MKLNKINIKSPIFILSLALFLIVATAVTFVPKTTWKRIFNGGSFATVYSAPSAPGNAFAITESGSIPVTGTSTFSFHIYSYKNTLFGRIYSSDYSTVNFSDSGSITAINPIPAAPGTGGYAAGNILTIQSGNSDAKVKVTGTSGTGAITDASVFCNNGASTGDWSVGGGNGDAVIHGDYYLGTINSSGVTGLEGLPGAGYSVGEVGLNGNPGGSGASIIIDSVFAGAITGVSANFNGSGYQLGDIVPIQDLWSGASNATVSIDSVDPDSGFVTGVSLVNGGTGYSSGDPNYLAGGNNDASVSINTDGPTGGIISWHDSGNKGSGYGGPGACLTLNGGNGNVCADATFDGNAGDLVSWGWVSMGTGYTVGGTGAGPCNVTINNVDPMSINGLQLINSGSGYSSGTYGLDGGTNQDAQVEIISTLTDPYQIKLNWDAAGADGYKVVVASDSVNGYSNDYSFDIATNTLTYDGTGGTSGAITGNWWNTAGTLINNNAVINNGTTMLTENEYVYTLTLATGGTLDLNGHTLYVESQYLNTGGTLIGNGGHIDIQNDYNNQHWWDIADNDGTIIFEPNDGNDLQQNVVINTNVNLTQDSFVGSIALAAPHSTENLGVNSNGTTWISFMWNDKVREDYLLSFLARTKIKIKYSDNRVFYTSLTADAYVDGDRGSYGYVTFPVSIPAGTVTECAAASTEPGTLNLNGHTLNVYGNWVNLGGTLINNGGTVNFVSSYSFPNQVIFGNNTFDNLERSSKNEYSFYTPGLYFDNSATTTINDTLSINGTSDKTVTVSKYNSLIPPLTSNHSPDGGLASASYAPYGDPGVVYRIFMSGLYMVTQGWVEYKFPSAKIVESYELDVSGSMYSQELRSWTLKGSNNESSWTTLDSKSNYNWNLNYQNSLSYNKKTFSFSNSVAYKYYRLYNDNIGQAAGVVIKLFRSAVNDNMNIKLGNSGTASLSYLNVASSTNLSSSPFVCTACTDGGNNVNWTFLAAPVLTSINISPLLPTVIINATSTFTSTPLDQYSNTYSTTTATTTWDSSQTSIGTINSSGLFTAISVGTTTVTATLGGVSTSTVVIVSLPLPILTTLTISPLSPSLTEGATTTFYSTKHDQYGATFATTTHWSSSVTSVGTINSGGIFTAVSAGTTTVTASAGSLTASTTVTVNPANVIATSTPKGRKSTTTDNGVGGDTDTGAATSTIFTNIGDAIANLLNPKPKVLTPINTVSVPVTVPTKLALQDLPVFGDSSISGKKSFTFAPVINTFLSAGLPDQVASVLDKSKDLKDYLAAVGITKVQDFIALTRKPLVVTGTSTPADLFTVSNGTTTLKTYITNDINYKLIQTVRVASSTSLIVSFTPADNNTITGTWNGRIISFVSNNNKATLKLTAPSLPGKYYLSTSASPLPLVIEVLNLQPISTSKATFISKVLGWLGL